MPLIDFLKMDYDKLQTYLYEIWDEDIDTKTSATGMRLLKILSSVGFMNVVYLVKSFKNAIFSEATDRSVTVKKARSEKGYKALPVVSAYVNITFSISAAKTTTVLIPKWTQLSTQDLTTNYTYYTVEDASILPGDTSVTVLAIEGARISLNFLATGIAYETFEIKRTDTTLREIQVYVNSTLWAEIDDIIDASSTDTIWTYEPGENGKIQIMFGNNFYGKQLSVNDSVDIWCLTSNGLDGIVKSNSITKVESTITDSLSAIVTDISCTNAEKPYGAAEMEDVDSIIAHSYSKYASNWGLVYLEQYTNAILARPGVDRAYCKDINTSLDVPFRQVWAYIIDSDGNDLADPYLSEVIDYVEAHMMIGTEFFVKPISYTRYEVSVNIWVSSGYNSTSVIAEVTNLLNTTFSKPEMEISEDISLATIGAAINKIDGVANYAIVTPTADITVPDGYLAYAVSVTVTYKGTI